MLPIEKGRYLTQNGRVAVVDSVGEIIADGYLEATPTAHQRVTGWYVKNGFSMNGVTRRAKAWRLVDRLDAQPFEVGDRVTWERDGQQKTGQVVDVEWIGSSLYWRVSASSNGQPYHPVNNRQADFLTGSARKFQRVTA
jgi:hypothetical protein